MPALRRSIAALLLVSFSTLSLSAQQTNRSPEEQPRKVKQEIKKAYVEWINDVDLILTQSDRDAWKKLATDNEREKFIEDFWRKQSEDWRQINDAGQRLTLSRLIDSRTLEPGEYKIQIRIRDQVSGETIAPPATFTIVP